MQETGSCCEGEYHVGPPIKKVEKPEVIMIMSSAQHDAHMQRKLKQEQERQNGK